MKIVHISNSDSIGGAAIAAYRIHCALLDSGLNHKCLSIPHYRRIELYLARRK